MKAKLSIIIGVILFATSGLYAVPVDKIFTSDGVIKEGDEYARVWVYDTPPGRTTVSMFGGSAYNVFTYNTSILNITDGFMWGLTAWDSSTVNVSGGFIESMGAHNMSSINMGGGEGNSFSAWDFGVFNAFGGTIGSLDARDNGTVNVWDNARIDILFPRDFGVVNMWGGMVDRTGAGEFGVLNLSGGFVYEGLWAGDSGIINVYGYDLAKFSTAGHYGFGFVSGEWADRTAFNIDLSGPDTYSRIILHEIPEPATVMLIVIGGVCLRKRRSF